MNSSTTLKESNGKKWQPRYFDVVAIGFVTTLLVSNIVATKLFSLGPAVFTAGILVFPISYIFGDILTEVYGYARTRRIIWMGLAANVFMAAILSLAIALPPAPGWNLQDAFAAVHGLVPAIVAGSIVGYWAGEFANSYIMSRLKVLMKARRLYVRTIASTIVGQFVDTTLFVTIAFGFVFPSELLIVAIISGWLFKVAYEVVATPITYVVVRYLKKQEGTEHFDMDADYNPFKLRVK